MRKIDLRPYKVTGGGSSLVKQILSTKGVAEALKKVWTEKEVERLINSQYPEYDVKKNLISIFLSRTLRLGGRQLLERHEIAKKIQDAKNEVLLEDGEFEPIKQIFMSNIFKGLGEPDVELVERIAKAERVEVEEVKEKK